jgi:hypothetical protein
MQTSVSVYNTGINAVRKNLYITNDNEKRIQHTRAAFLQDDPIDLQYTTVVNMFIELGYRLFYTNWSQPEVGLSSEELRSIVARYIFDASLADKGVNDQMTDIMNRRLWRQYQQAKKIEAKGVTG